MSLEKQIVAQMEDGYKSVSLDVKEVIKTNKDDYIVIVETVRSFAEEALQSFIDFPKTKDNDREN